MTSPSLSPNERIVFEAIKRAARAGEPCPSNLDLAALIDCDSIATPSRALKQLELKRYVEVKRYQQARQVFIRGTDLATAEPRLKRRHWRFRGRYARHELQDDIAERVANGASIAQVAAALEYSVVHIRVMWNDIKRQLGWQAS